MHPADQEAEIRQLEEAAAETAFSPSIKWEFAPGIVTPSFLTQCDCVVLRIKMESMAPNAKRFN
jgi:hypothetical protein